jgi:GNAT superfamily N-acetyltransferase
MATVRRAEPEDAGEVAALLVRSIREVCGPDYDNDEAVLVAWCANKTPENMRRGILNPNNYWIIALDGDAIAGTALMSNDGEVHLCYLLPEYLGRGFGKAMLNDMMDYARASGLQKVMLESTRTAREFYLRNGFVETGASISLGLIPCYTMERSLS